MNISNEDLMESIKVALNGATGDHRTVLKMVEYFVCKVTKEMDDLRAENRMLQALIETKKEVARRQLGREGNVKIV